MSNSAAPSAPKPSPFMQAIILDRWLARVDVYVETARLIGGTLKIAREYGVRNVQAKVTPGGSEGWNIAITYEAAPNHARALDPLVDCTCHRCIAAHNQKGGKTITGGPWVGIRARCLGSRADAWKAAGQLACLLESIGAAGEDRRWRRRYDAAVAAEAVSA